MEREERTDLSHWLLLAKLGLTPLQVDGLLGFFGTPRAVFEASREELMLAGGGSARLYDRVRHVERSADLAEMMRLLAGAGAEILTIADSRYPRSLREIPGAPPVLFARGNVNCLSAPCVAIVGSRTASPYGKRAAEELAQDLARCGMTVVSGLAVGVDAAAHKGALAGGGKTVGVLGCSIEIWYPAANRVLRRQIEASGAVVTEFPPRSEPQPWAFPRRNRIVSGLCLGTVIVEAPEKSGALITASLAMEQNREVMAVPGEIYSGKSRGCHALIRDGAALVESAEDVLRVLGLPDAQAQAAIPTRADLSLPERKVLNTLTRDGLLVEALTEPTGLSAADVVSSLMLLEMKGCVKRLPGGRYAAI